MKTTKAFFANPFGSWSIVASIILISSVESLAAEAWEWELQKDRLEIRFDHKLVASYVFRDREITRPFWQDVHTLGGALVTRPKPPGPNDLQDHPTMHPGIWIAFGDLNGHDFWRLKAKVNHVRFLEGPNSKGDHASFVVENEYRSTDDAMIVCRETCRYDLYRLKEGILLCSDSRFQSSESSLRFGDQEEMGLGIRLATSIAVKQKQGGKILDSEGRTDTSIWGQRAAWCDYSGYVEGKTTSSEGPRKPCGMMIVPDPRNDRPCRWHARDYGFVAANLYGSKSFRDATSPSIVVEKEQVHRFRIGVLIHDGIPGQGFDPDSAYSHCIQRFDL